MSHSHWYSPRIRRDLITQLYFRAKAEKIPMTRLTDRLLEQALAMDGTGTGADTRLAENPEKPTASAASPGR
jgi:hypothetical protein